MNNGKQQQLNEEMFDLLIKQAAREVAEEETQEATDMCAGSPPFTTSPDYEARITRILESPQGWAKKHFRFKALTAVAITAVVMFILLATPVAADFRSYINQVIFGKAPTHNTIATMEYYDIYKASLIESGLERLYIPTHPRLREVRPAISIETVNSHTEVLMNFHTGDFQYSIRQVCPGSNTPEYDTERSDVKQIEVNGRVAFMWEDKGYYSVFMFSDSFIIDVTSNTSADITVEIAETLTAINLEEV